MSVEENSTGQPGQGSAEGRAGRGRSRGRRRLTLDECIDVCKRCSSRTEVSKKHPGAYKTIISMGWKEQCFSCLPKLRKPPLWGLSSCHKEAKKYMHRSDFRDGSPGAYDSARRNGWLNYICGHMRRKSTARWTLESCSAEASKYKSRADFSKFSSGAYGRAKVCGWLDQICQHMMDSSEAAWSKRDDRWTREKIFSAARECDSYAEMKMRFGRALHVAAKVGIRDEIKGLFPRVNSSPSMCYIWRASGVMYAGRPVYKIGVCMDKRGNYRINAVAKSNGLVAEDVIKFKASKPRDLEKMALEIGLVPDLGFCDGKTEFRAMTDNEYEKAKTILSSG